MKGLAGMAPILLLLFNRPDLTEGLIACLRRAAPEQLFIAIDGPRVGVKSDFERVNEVRRLAEAIDWQCEKRWLIRERNLGCGLAVSGAITWFFDQVEEGIILEDDCHPDPTFFQFSSFMLEKYRDDTRVFMASGTSLLPDSVHLVNPYYFSKYMGIWGWACWRRAWKAYDYDLASLSAGEWENLVRARSANAVECRYWLHILELMLKGEIDTWDFQVQFCAWKANALHLTSSRNLVENLGFRGDATHTKGHSPLAERRAQSNPPPYAEVPVLADESLDRIVFGEKLHASLALAEWLFGESQERDRARQVERLSADLVEAQSRIGQLSSEIASLNGEIQSERSELARYYGFSGALRCLRKMF